MLSFQHTAARRRLLILKSSLEITPSFQHTAARRRLTSAVNYCWLGVNRFNTQPPEGGWQSYSRLYLDLHSFQHTAARRRLMCFYKLFKLFIWFQHTAARRRLHHLRLTQTFGLWFQHTAARRRLVSAAKQKILTLSFNTQPPEGG